MRNLEGVDIDLANHCQYVQCLRRANLDAMNARAGSTIRQHAAFIQTAVRNAKAVNRTPFFPPRGPMPLNDSVGMGLAVDLLLKGINSRGRIKRHIQYDTMRKGRSTFSLAWASSPMGTNETAAFTSTRNRINLTSCPTQSDWFRFFMLGCQDRMGFDTKNQLDLPIKAVVAMVRLAEEDLNASDSASERNLLIKFASFITILTAASLRGHEGFYLDIAGTRKHVDRGRNGVIPSGSLIKKLLSEEEAANLPEVCICLMGKFKGETGERYHSIILANETCSGLQPRRWIEELLKVCSSEGRTAGCAFNGPDGSPPSPSEYNGLVRHYVEVLRDEGTHGVLEDAELVRYGISRTFRKTSETRARRAGIPKEQVETVNRWKKIERAKGKRPQFAMVDHYANARELSTLTWKYAYAL